MKYLSALMCFLLPLASHAELHVIADLGGEDAAPYFEAINKQPDISETSAALSPPPVEGMATMLPVNTPEMAPGEIADRPLQLPGIGALFLVGDDARSRAWLEHNADALLARRAVGMIVNVDRLAAVQALRDLAPDVPMSPASGSELARRLQLQHYPVLITDTGLSQQVRP